MTPRKRCALGWLIVAMIVGIVCVWMPARDRQINEAEHAFYSECQPHDSEKVIVVRVAGLWECHERHEIRHFAQGDK